MKKSFTPTEIAALVAAGVLTLTEAREMLSLNK
jgi:xanthine/CO dehydrogenase XdhC/CoxF family maturation factor